MHLQVEIKQTNISTPQNYYVILEIGNMNGELFLLSDEITPIRLKETASKCLKQHSPDLSLKKNL